jgi:hypothetical protein
MTHILGAVQVIKTPATARSDEKEIRRFHGQNIGLLFHRKAQLMGRPH